ncbi:MAG TPA: isoprenyl transferase [Thermoanaerobacterales bacterium]|nr:isoprenyl transferase [Thermoanaerobacterales bacterium]
MKERLTVNITEQDLDYKRIPTHIAIIMDGNGRWAKKRGLPRVMGHRAGIKTVREIIKSCSELNVKILSLFAFSTENWRRPKEEVDALMDLLVLTIENELDELIGNNIIIKTIGDKGGLPKYVQKKVVEAEEKTKKNTGMIVNVALNYGGRKEIVDGVKEICKKVINNEISINDIDEHLFSQMLYTKGLPDPDLLIRPSGELRLSNFLLWQNAYTELWFTPVFWPDFTKEHLISAIKDYQKRDRRFGNV